MILAVSIFNCVQTCVAGNLSWVDVEFSGRVVDDQTGKLVTGFALQMGWPDQKNSSNIGWGGYHYSGHHEEGRFSMQTGWEKGKKLWLRVLADGYLPQPVTAEPLVSPASAKNLEVRLKRGREIRGQVVDHMHSPVARATVFLGGYQLLNLVNGQAEHFYCSRTTTDEDGRFVLSGVNEEAKAIIVSADTLDVYCAPMPRLSEQSRIELPEPATAILRYDIAGEKQEGQFHLYLKTFEMEEWRNVVASVQKHKVLNGGKAVLKNLTPGVYDIGRMKELRLGDMGRAGFCDRRTITVEAGKVTHVDFVRQTGQPIQGEIVDLQGCEVPGAFIYIKSAESTGDPYNMDEWMLTTFDSLTCDVSGRFKSARILPGSYTVIANAYKPESRTYGYSGIRLPDFIGVAKVAVPNEGQPPHVCIQMKPRSPRSKNIE